MTGIVLLKTLKALNKPFFTMTGKSIRPRLE